MIGDRSSNGAPGTEHQSVFPEGHQTWEQGITCDECRELYAQRQARHEGQSILVSGLTRMKDYEYHSVGTMEKQAIAQARAAGIEPERA
jgi:hypothetical protein